jgi:hypothetical protein
MLCGMIISLSDPGRRYVYRIFSADARKSSLRGCELSTDDICPGELESPGVMAKLARGGISWLWLLP